MEAKMEEKIAGIIRELIELDPSLRSEQAAMRETIIRLLGEKPDSAFDEKFGAELKARLLKEFSAKKRGPGRPRKYWGLAAMLLVGVLALAVWLNHERPEESIMKELPPERPLAEAQDPQASPTQVPAEEKKDETLKEAESPQITGVTGLPERRLRSSEESDETSKAQPEKREQIVSKLERRRAEIRDKEESGEVGIEGGVEGRVVGGVEGGVIGGVLGGVLSSVSRQEFEPTGRPSYFEDRPGCSLAADFNTEAYATIRENDFLPALDNPLSTFSIDVDTASYANVRRFLMQNRLPPKDAVRIEELINYFSYDHPQPKGRAPLAVHAELGLAPWNPEHKLAMIALQGKDLAPQELPPSNLVFLIDVSGSMDQPNKLPLLIESFKLLVHNLSRRDRVAMVVYAGAAGVVLPSTPAAEKTVIIAALERLRAGGSTAGGAGIALAYKIARENFIEGGNNRVILATDGDFNIGPSSDAEMERLIEEQRQHGVFLTVLGFGMGNYKDSKMETLADKGNGNYAYIDSLLEARKVLGHDLRKTLFTIAKDVKIQVEFNPARVGAYRLIGYENRLLKKEDFRDDRKDAGEIGAGHTVTVFYEIIPAEKYQREEIPLKYQDSRVRESARQGNELLTIRVRYKNPQEDSSRELGELLKDKPRAADKLSSDMLFASAVAEFGLLLRDSQYRGQASFESLLVRARANVGAAPHGYRQEFLRLAETAMILKRNRE